MRTSTSAFGALLFVVLLLALVQTSKAQVYTYNSAEVEFVRNLLLRNPSAQFPSGWDVGYISRLCTGSWEGVRCDTVGNEYRIMIFELGSVPIGGPFPSDLVNLAYLETLTLSDLGLTGTIPAFMSQLSFLRSLDLSGNHLNGTVPNGIWDKELMKLNLAGNDLEGDLPNFPSNWAFMGELTLSGNKFTGTISSSITNLYFMQSFKLDSNMLSGSIPPEIFTMPMAYFIDISDNRLNGTIPAIPLNPALFLVDLSNNQLTGPFPDISGAVNLTSLNLGLNRLSGPLPAEVALSNRLTTLIIKENLFTGNIPTEISDIRELTMFDIATNFFEGEIPESIYTLLNLSHLSVENNNLVGSLSSSFCQLKELNFVNLAGNGFHGELPTCLGELTLLSAFYADFNNFSGTIPASMGYLTELTHFQLSGNKLTGAIPSSLGNATRLQYLILGDNLLDSAVPYELSLLKNLITLDLSSNRLHGPFPYAIATIERLKALQIANNQLECPLATIATLDLESCDAGFNYLCGGENSTSLFSPSCSQFFSSACKLTECKTKQELKIPPGSLRVNGKDGSYAELDSQRPVITIHTVDPRTKRKSSVKVEILSFNENVLPGVPDQQVASPTVMNTILSSTLDWTLGEIDLKTPRNGRFPYFRYSAHVEAIAGNVTVSIAYIPNADNIRLYNETLNAVDGAVKINIAADNWQIISRPDQKDTWAISTVFKLSALTDKNSFKTSQLTTAKEQPKAAKVSIPFEMSVSEMPGLVRVLQNGITGTPGTLSPWVRLAYNSSKDLQNANKGTSSFILAAYFPMKSTANVTFEYDVIAQLQRTPIPPPKKQIMGSTAGFAILMIALILGLITLLCIIILYKNPALKRKILPCLGRATDPVEYL